MARINRRDFLKGSLATAGGIALFNISGTRAGGQIIGANDRIRIAVAGLHGRGGNHLGAFANLLSDAIREMRPEVAVLLVSGYTSDVIDPAGVGPRTAFLEKPFTPEALLARVREALEG